MTIFVFIGMQLLYSIKVKSALSILTNKHTQTQTLASFLGFSIGSTVDELGGVGCN
jgi:hypothetical protein